MKYIALLIFVSMVFLNCKQSDTSKSELTSDMPIQETLYEYDVEEKLKTLNISLSESSPPVANYVNAVQTGNLIFMAGKGPRDEEGKLITGTVGKDLTIEQGYNAARLVAVAQLSELKAELGDLNRVKRIVKVLGLVNCIDGFGNQPEVINGFSDLMVEVFGERGKHARAAIGTNALPRNIACEIEMIVEVN